MNDSLTLALWSDSSRRASGIILIVRTSQGAAGAKKLRDEGPSRPCRAFPGMVSAGIFLPTAMPGYSVLGLVAECDLIISLPSLMPSLHGRPASAPCRVARAAPWLSAAEGGCASGLKVLILIR